MSAAEREGDRPGAGQSAPTGEAVDSGRGSRRFDLDAAQRAAADRLAALLDRRGHPRRGGGGVYLYGPPGRGKTMLMDRFFTGTFSKRKRRWHFHEFFAHLHAAATTTSTVADAVTRLIGDAELICFDEFHVHDIGDAMLVARLLDAVFDRRVPLVVTSNYPPADLLPNPLFHDRFLPAIARITEHMTVVALDGPQDYRRLRAEVARHRAAGTVMPSHGPQTLADQLPGGVVERMDDLGDERAEVYGAGGARLRGTAPPPTGPACAGSGSGKDGLRRSVAGVARIHGRRADGPDPCTGFAAGIYSVGGTPSFPGTTVVRVGARAFTVRSAANATLAADFAELCGAELSAADYVALAARFERWIVVGVPRLREVPPDQAMRWVNLVDVLYDADRTLTVHAAVPLEELATGVARVAGVADLGRTVSRLYEISHHRDARAG
ncbi:cell division protein ZapE [Nocardia higoensis]|nr:cell division protein ZapE [Nocardia higoensis]